MHFFVNLNCGSLYNIYMRTHRNHAAGGTLQAWQCLSFKTFTEAILKCGQMVDCGGITQSGANQGYELR